MKLKDVFKEAVIDPKQPITGKFFSNGLLNNIKKVFASKIKNYSDEEIKNGIVFELEQMQIYTIQSLNKEKLNIAINRAINKLSNNSNQYKDNEIPSIKQQISHIFTESFNFNSFKNLTPRQQFDLIFSKKFDKMRLGKGSSRVAINIGNGKILKFAINNAGKMQNREEVKIYKKFEKYQHLITKIYDYDPTFQYVISEIVRPLSNIVGVGEKQFEKYSGINYEDFANVIEAFYEGKPIDDKWEENYFITDILLLMKETGLISGDVVPTGHWGVDSEGKLKLLDFGYTKDIESSYIDPKQSDYTFRIPASFLEQKENLIERKQFDFSAFKKMSPLEQLRLLTNLPERNKVGIGTSRIAFILGTGKAIKLAYNNAGIAQNEGEVEINQKYKEFSDLMPKVYDFDPKFHWIMSELVKPLSTESEEDSKAEKIFYDFCGVSYNDFFYNLEQMFTTKKVNKEVLNNSFFQRVFKFVKKTKIDPGDIALLYNMGVTAEGKIVFLDVGMTKKVYNDFYTAKNDDNFEKLPSSFHESFKLKNIYKNNILTEKKFFDLKQFKSMPPIKQILFLKQKGKVVGEGSSRRVYLLDQNTVLKLAKNEKGLAQNKTEVESFKDPLTNGLVTKIYDYSMDFRWLISEIARPISNMQEFGKLLGENAEDFFHEFSSMVEFYFSDEGEEINTDEISNPLLGKLMDLVIKNETLPADLKKMDSWGKTADGRLVLIDYGFTDSVWRQHYKPKDEPTPDSDAETATRKGS